MDDRDRLAYSSDIVLALHRHHLRAFLQFGYILLTDENEAKVHARTTEKDTHTHTRKRTHTHTHSRPDCRDIEAVSIDWDSTDRSMQTQHSFLSSKKNYVSASTSMPFSACSFAAKCSRMPIAVRTNIPLSQTPPGPRNGEQCQREGTTRGWEIAVGRTEEAEKKQSNISSCYNRLRVSMIRFQAP